MSDPFELSAALAAKIGSIVVHAEEAVSDDGHPFDVEAIKVLVSQPDVQEWLLALSSMALVPRRRK